MVLAQIVSILLDGKCQRALLVAAKSTDCAYRKKQSFSVTHLFLLTLTGSSKFEERQSVDDNLNF